MHNQLLARLFKSGLMWLWVAFIILMVDRYSKTLATQYLIYHEPVSILPIFNLTLTYNTGAAFSFLHGSSGWQNWFLGGMAGVASLILLGWLAGSSIRDYWANTAICLVLGGALGNAWDRILYGHVIDFLSFHFGDWYFAIFNIADSAICIGVVMLSWHWLRKP
jgi:signal peptidase II